MKSRVISLLQRCAEFASVTFFVAMFGAFLLQIFMRYVVNQPLSWTIEACVITYIWVVFWSAAFLVRKREHVTFTIFRDLAPPRLRRYLGILGAAVVGVAFASAYPAGFDFITFMKIDTTPVTRIRFDFVYSVWLLFAASVVVRSFYEVFVLARQSWMAPASPSAQSAQAKEDGAWGGKK